MGEKSKRPKDRMNKKKIALIALLGIIQLGIVSAILFVGGVVLLTALLSGTKSDEDIINEYMEKEYGQEIEMVHYANKHTGNVGNVSHKVNVKGLPEWDFWVDVEGFFRTSVKDDGYVKGQQDYIQEKKLLSEEERIHALGFDNVEELEYRRTYVDYLDDHEGFVLNVRDKKVKDPLNYKQGDAYRMWRLIIIAEDSGIDVDKLYIETEERTRFVVEDLHLEESDEALLERLYEEVSLIE